MQRMLLCRVRRAVLMGFVVVFTAAGFAEPASAQVDPVDPSYWNNNLANTDASGPFHSTECKAAKKEKGRCSLEAPWAIQYLPKLLGNYSVDSIVEAAAVFRSLKCKAKDPIGCLAAEGLGTKLNLANGSLACPSILQAVADTDAFLKGQTVEGVAGINYVGPSGDYALTDAQHDMAESLQDLLDGYNSDLGCP